MKHYLAFDLGASSGRAILGTLSGKKLELKEIHRFTNGHKRIDGSLFWDFPVLVNELKTGVKKALEITSDICSIGIDTWGVDYVLFDNDSKLMRRLPFHYRDSRSDAVVDEVFARISKSELYRRTGIQFMPLNTLYQLYAHKKSHPEDLVNSTFLHMPDALGFALGGDFTTEYTDASTSNLLDVEKRNWDFELIEMLGIPKSIFPKIVQPCTRSGFLNLPGAPKIPIVKVGSHDTASAVGAVPAEPAQKFAYISCGTWALLGAELDEPSIKLEAQTFTNEGGLNGKIRYLTNIMGCWLLQECKRDFAAKGQNFTFPDMIKMAQSVDGLKYFINPNDAKFAPPDEMIKRIRQYCHDTNQTAELSDAEVIRTIYDSLALCFKNKLEELELLRNTNYQVLNIIGGGTQDANLMQLAANAIGKTVIAGPVEATAIGNILAQAITMQEVGNLDEARAIVRNSFDVIAYHPDLSQKSAWLEADRKFKNLIKG